MRPSTSLLPLLALPALALSQLDTFRATVEGSLHQCQSSQLFFFDSGDARPLSVLFLPSASIPAAARNGTVLLQDALGYSPVLALGDITAADASGWDFEVQVAAGTEFEIFGFLPDGSGKDLSLTRTVMTPLPDATACLTNIPTTIDVVATATPSDVVSETAATQAAAATTTAAPVTLTSATVAAVTSTAFLTTTSTPAMMTVTVTATATSLPSASASASASASPDATTASSAVVSSASGAVFASGGGRGAGGAGAGAMGLALIGALAVWA